MGSIRREDPGSRDISFRYRDIRDIIIWCKVGCSGLVVWLNYGIGKGVE